MTSRVVSFRMDTLEIDALDKVVDGLRKLDYRLGDKEMTRAEFIKNAVKTSASQAVKIIERDLEKIEEA